MNLNNLSENSNKELKYTREIINGNKTFNVLFPFGDVSFKNYTANNNKIFKILSDYEKSNIDPFGGDKYNSKTEVIACMFDKIKKFKNIDYFFSFIDDLVEKKEGIIITGDYDADGIGSAVIFADFLDILGIPYKVRLPEREKDGYGIRPDNVSDLLNYSLGKDGFNNVIALDNGVNSVEVNDILKELGYKYMIIDHHTEDEELIAQGIDQTDFQLNPHLKENKENILTEEANMCTGQLVYMFGLSYLKSREHPLANEFMKNEVDMLLLTTICDMMPLTGLNRGIVKYFKNDILLHGGRIRISIKKMLDEGLDGPFIHIDPEDPQINNIEKFIGWTLGPNINALGRIDKPINAFKFIRNAGISYEYVIENNEKRKELSKVITKEILSSHKEDLESPDKKCFLYKGGEHSLLEEGIQSILSGSISNNYKKITGIGYEKHGEIRYSFRSLNGIDIKKLISKKYVFKGHSEAGVCIINDYEEKDFIKFMHEETKDLEIKQEYDIVCEIPKEMMNLNTIHIINKVGPFGMGNPVPKFLFKGKLNKWRSEMHKADPYSKYSSGGKQKLQLDMGGRKFTIYNFGETIPVSELIKTNGVMGLMSMPFGGFSKEPIIIMDHLIK